MRGAALALACLLCAPGPGFAQTNEAGQPEETEVEEDGNSRFKRAPFRTYNELPGPRRPERITQIETEVHGGATLRQLDKMTGGIETVEVRTSEERRVGRLRIRLDACRTAEDSNLGGAIAFLKIWDLRNDTDMPDFSGWMFAESPALSAFDHPRYDVWVISCITDEGGAEAASE